MHKTGRRVVSFMLTLLMTSGILSPLGNIAYANVSLGGSSSPGGGNEIYNTEGGGFEYHINDKNFRVSVQRNPELFNDGTQESKDKVLENFSYKYPSEWDTETYFLNADCVRGEQTGGCGWTSDAKNHYIKKYNTSSGKFDTYRSQTAKNLIFGMKYITSKPANLYKSKLSEYSYNNPSKKDITELSNGKWQSIAHSKSPDECLTVWSYILATIGKDQIDVTNRFNEYVSQYASKITPDSPDTQKEDVSLGYLDLLMSLWKLNKEKGNSVASSNIANAIEDYIRVASPEEKPVAIVIDLVANINETPTAKEHALIPFIDLQQNYTHLRTGQDFMSITNASAVGDAKGSTKKIFEKLVNKARDEHGWNLKENFSDKWSNSTWNWTASSIFEKYKRLITYNGKYANYNKANSEQAIMESLYLGDNPKGIWGFTAFGFQINDIAPSELGFKLIATPDNEMIDYKSEVIGQQVKLDLQISDVDSRAINAWETILKRVDNSKVNVKLTIKRDGSTSNGKYTSNLGDLQKGVDMTTSNFLSLIKGTTSIKWVDDTTNIAIKSPEKKVFNYEVKVEVNWKENGVAKNWVSADFGDKEFDIRDTASFIRPETPPDPMYYNNYPIQYAEVKEGTPDNETFEAMAGVPSTERLYFGAGGVEFVVDVELEFKRDTDAVWRTYQSYFTGTSCEYKQGDTSPNKTVGGQSMNMHGGDSKSKVWNGSIPNKASAVTALHSASCPAQPDYSAYNAALAEANAFAAEVRGTVHTHMSASDKVNRQYSGWNVAVSPSPSPPTDTSASASCSYVPATENSPGTPCGNEMATASPSGPGSYTITVTWSVPAHIICGPCCLHELPQVQDTWKQRVNIDYLKINKVEVYRLTEGRLTPVNAIFGGATEELRTQSNTLPTIFYNIAQKNAGGNDTAAQSSRYGRLRYTLEPQMHDTVVWNEGVRTNKCNGQGSNGVSGPLGQANSNCQGIMYTNGGYTTELNYHINKSNNYDKARPEWQKFDERRNLRNNVTVISDMLILQTSSGDKSVMYFDKEGVEITSQEQFADVNATKLEMWDSNPNSSARWSDNEIPIGSYNGNFTRTGKGSGNNQKYWGYGYDTKQFYSAQSLPKVPTIFDNDPAKTISRTSRPGKLYLYRDAQIERTIQNKLYNTGDATVFYERILNWESPNPYDEDPYVHAGVQLRPLVYDAQPQAKFGGRVGFVEDAYYSDNHTKVNDIIIHTPVSTEDAMIIGLPSDRDQRTDTPPGANQLIEEQNKLKVCPLTPESCDFKVLNCEFLHEKEMLSVDFDSMSNGKLLNKVTNEYVPYSISNGMKIEPKDGFGSGNVLHATGTRFSMNLADIGIAYDRGLSYLIEMDFLMPSAPENSGAMIVSFANYDFYVPKGSTVGTFNTGNGWERKLDVNLVGTPMKLGLEFSFGHIDDCKLYINGVEQKNVVRVNTSNKITEDLVGEKLNIGSWGASDSYGGNFYVDNLKVTKAKGSSEHTNACYIDTKVHGVIKNHVHTDSCYSKSASNKYACNGLPLNAGGSIPKNTSTTYKNWTFNSGLEGFVSGTVSISNSNGALVVGATNGDYYFYSPSGLGYAGKSGDYIEITLRNNSINTQGQVFFNNGSGWSEACSTVISLGVNEDGYRTYIMPVGSNTNWVGKTISQLRFDLANGSGSGTVQVDNIAIKNGGLSPSNTSTVRYTANSSGKYLSLRSGTQQSGGSAITTGAGQGVFGPYIRAEQDATYKIVVNGSGLQNGRARLLNDYGQVDWSSSVKYISRTSTRVEYIVTIPKTTDIMEYCWEAVNANRMVIDSMDISTTPNTAVRHEHNNSCPKIQSGSLICGYNSELSITDKNSHVHDANCGTYNGYTCYNKPLNSGKVYKCNNLPLNANYVTTNKTFSYTGAVQTFTAPGDGTYTLEVWGAQGGSRSGGTGGLGGYSKGNIVLKAGETLNIYVGQQPTSTAGGWNGGGSTGGSAAGGGGATDIRKGGTALTNRIIVAGGGGGSQARDGGAGGGLNGSDGVAWYGTPGLGGTQTAGGGGGGYPGTLGQGGNGKTGSDGLYGGAGGGGYYGGGGATSDISRVDDSGGGGGSGYIGGVTNGTTVANSQAGHGKAVITGGSVPTGHTHTSSCAYEYTTHSHTASCATVSEYSCGGQVKNAHTDVTNYTGGNRTYGAFENVGGKKLSTNGVLTAEGAFRISTNQVITGPGDEYIAGTYLVTLRGTNLNNVTLKAKDSTRNYVTTPLNKDDAKEVKFLLGVMDKTSNLTFEIKSTSGVVELMDMTVAPITLREPIGLCHTCDKYVILKANGTKVQCTVCNTNLFDLGERINFMTSTLNDAQGNRQITVLGDGGSVAVVRAEEGYVINGNLPTQPNRNFEPYVKYETAMSQGCKTISELGCTEPHHSNSHYDGGNDICWDACGVDENHVYIQDEVVDTNTGTVNHNATFINLDYGFRMYFPNVGDFAEDTNLKGITAPTSTRGQGYIDNMPTTKYTQRKSVWFEFNVIYNDRLYLAGERIDLNVPQEYFDFYCVLANREAVAAKVEWEVVAINGRPIDESENDNYGSVSNKHRYSDFTALHGGYKKTWVDVVGRIGNFAISDTDDFRFSNFFKIPTQDEGWLIEGILPTVHQDKQNLYYGDLVDIRGEKANEDTNYLNTYGSQKWLEQEPVPAPINPKDNPVAQLREKFLKVGYDIYGDITTIGDYQDGMVRALPYYYFIDIDTNSVIPLDVYMKDDSTYKLINSYGGADDNTIPESIYHNNMIMNWEKESVRRNYMMEESLITDRLADIYREPVEGNAIDEDGNSVRGIVAWKDMERPKGDYTYQGISQRYVLDSTSKTYIGSSKTYGEEKNLGGLIAENVWEDNAQRWHLKFGLPSSAVFVEHGVEPTQENIDSLLNRNGVVLNCMDIIGIGTTYTLRWQQPGITSFTIEKEGSKKTYNIKNLGLPPVIALYEAGKTSVDDITINGTH